MLRCHKIIPSRIRKKLLKSRSFLWLFKAIMNGRTNKTPWLGSFFYFDAYRNFGFSTVSLDDIEREQRNFARQFIKNYECNVAWDIGANIGYWTVWLSSVMKSGAKIISFEPDKKNIIYLDMNVASSGGNVDILNIALSSRVGNGYLNTDETGALNSINIIDHVTYTGCENIDIMTIDSVVERCGVPDFIKLDVEGHEYDVLQGATSVLKHGKTVWLIELTKNCEEVIDLLEKNDYAVLNMLGEKISHPEYYIGAIPNKIYDNLGKREIWLRCES